LQNTGEYHVKKILGKTEGIKEVFHDLYVHKSNGKLTQIDHVVITQCGIFVIETKNYSGWIFGSEDQRTWTQTIYRKKSRFYNPIMQNNTHMNALAKYLQTDVPIYSMIVFSNAVTFKFTVEFETAKVIQFKDLKNTLEQFEEYKVNQSEMNRLKILLEKLQSHSKEEKKLMKEQHIEYVKEMASSNNCPRCGQKLVERNSSRGKFYGCNGFPKCRFTKAITE